MKKTLILIALTISTAFFATSCKNDDEVAPSAVAGSWSLQTFDSEVKITGLIDDKDSENVSSENFTIDLLADGKFTSNFSFSVLEIITPGAVSGTYEEKDGNVILKFNDGTDNVVFYLKIKQSTDKDLILIVDKTVLAKTLLSIKDKETTDELSAYLAIAEKLEYTFNFKKK